MGNGFPKMEGAPYRQRQIKGRLDGGERKILLKERVSGDKI